MIEKILRGTKRDIKDNIKLLADDYLKKTNRKVCLSCASDVAYMILTLKNIYKMCEFKLKGAVAQYKNKKGDKTTVKNSTLTNEIAIEFLRTDKKRISLFSKYPSNWEKLLDGVQETAEQKDNRLAAEAEMNTAKEAKETVKEPEAKVETKDESEDESEAVKEALKAAGVDEKTELEEELFKMDLKGLREKYPEIKASSRNTFIAKVLESI